MIERHDIFLSYSRNDLEAATQLLGQLEKAGLIIFRDQESIHETLIRSKGMDAAGQPQPYRPTLWQYIEQHRGQAVLRERARLLALEMEDAAIAWDAAGRPEPARWSEDRVQEIIREVRRSGLSPDEVVRSGVPSAVFGPVDLEEIVELLALGEAEDPIAGSERYGGVWRLPFSHKARAVLGDRLAVIGDRRRGVALRTTTCRTSTGAGSGGCGNDRGRAFVWRT